MKIVLTFKKLKEIHSSVTNEDLKKILLRAKIPNPEDEHSAVMVEFTDLQADLYNLMEILLDPGMKLYYWDVPGDGRPIIFASNLEEATIAGETYNSRHPEYYRRNLPNILTIVTEITSSEWLTTTYTFNNTPYQEFWR